VSDARIPNYECELYNQRELPPALDDGEVVVAAATLEADDREP
jgi:hypothetical protein